MFFLNTVFTSVIYKTKNSEIIIYNVYPKFFLSAFNRYIIVNKVYHYKLLANKATFYKIFLKAMTVFVCNRITYIISYIMLFT